MCFPHPRTFYVPLRSTFLLRRMQLHRNKIQKDATYKKAASLESSLYYENIFKFKTIDKIINNVPKILVANTNPPSMERLLFFPQ